MKKNFKKRLKKVQKIMKTINKLLVNLNKCFIKFSNEMKKFFLVLILFSLCLCSCNVTRVMTNESQYFQRGDTAVVIQTKTTETYNAEKNNVLWK